MKSAWFLAGATLAAGAAGLFAIVPPRSLHAAAAPYTVRVESGTVTRIQPLAGTVASTNDVSVAYSGPQTTVAQVLVAIGQQVVSGQSLATTVNGTTLTAPVAGTVVSLSLNAGDLVPSVGSGAIGASSTGRQPVSGQSVVSTGTAADTITIADTHSLEVTAAVSEMAVHWFHVGQSAAIIIPGEPGVRYTGKIAAVDQTPMVSGAVVSYPLVFSLAIPPGAATPWLGMSCQLFVPVARATGVAVPIAAIAALPGGGYGVTLASGQVQPVTLGLIGLNQAIVTKGLTIGQAIRTPAPFGRTRVTVGL
ncbi:MAG: HlyD family efflux transporter periplasmic adaptor subunit [Thermaerobacter sp.]|nr:HlyD family efflux transporter periplasmic adaptor subunit [Thermaerobacter sp.]